MKLLFVSDNHGDAAILKQISQHFGGQVAGMFHCGDSNLDATDPVMAPFQTVVGNTDWGPEYPTVISEQVGEVKVVVTHGHRYQVNTTLTPLILLGRQEQADVVAFGHTHQLGCQVVNDTLLINPGSISQPRGQYAGLGGTLAVVDVLPDRFEVQYYDREMQPVAELQRTLKR